MPKNAKSKFLNYLKVFEKDHPALYKALREGFQIIFDDKIPDEGLDKRISNCMKKYEPSMKKEIKDGLAFNTEERRVYRSLKKRVTGA